MTLSSCYFLGIKKTDEPRYKTILKEGSIEVRDYSGYIIAQATTLGEYQDTSNSSFRKLAAYIFGDNTVNEKISMTAPVFQEKKVNSWVMSFVMPEKYTFENLPQPINKDIHIIQIPPKKVAVINYSGFVLEEKMNKFNGELIQWIIKNGYKPLSEMRSARYNPPWTLPFMRRNEIHIDVSL
jgi:DNA gyrase inhibitor GyrI